MVVGLKQVVRSRARVDPPRDLEQALSLSSDHFVQQCLSGVSHG
jgi:hypothetical protein